MLAVLIDRKAWARKAWIGKSTKRDGGHAWPILDDIGDGRSAVGAKAIGNAVAAIGGSYPGRYTSGYSDVFIGPTRLCRESAAGSLLAFEAMANGYPDWLSFALRTELATAASRDANIHRATLI